MGNYVLFLWIALPVLYVLKQQYVVARNAGHARYFVKGVIYAALVSIWIAGAITIAVQ